MVRSVVKSLPHLFGQPFGRSKVKCARNMKYKDLGQIFQKISRFLKIPENDLYMILTLPVKIIYHFDNSKSTDDEPSLQTAGKNFQFIQKFKKQFF